MLVLRLLCRGMSDRGGDCDATPVETERIRPLAAQGNRGDLPSGHEQPAAAQHPAPFRRSAPEEESNDIKEMRANESCIDRRHWNDRLAPAAGGAESRTPSQRHCPIPRQIAS